MSRIDSGNLAEYAAELVQAGLDHGANYGRSGWDDRRQVTIGELQAMLEDALARLDQTSIIAYAAMVSARLANDEELELESD